MRQLDDRDITALVMWSLCIVDFLVIVILTVLIVGCTIVTVQTGDGKIEQEKGVVIKESIKRIP